MKLNNAISVLLLNAACFLPLTALAVDVYVISNNGVTLQASDIRDVYIGEKQTEGATKLMPIENLSLQKDFLEKVVKVDLTKYGTIWTKKGFREGLNPPSMKTSDAEVISAVKSTPGAIGYVSKPTAAVNVISKY